MTAQLALSWTCRILGIAIALQGIELWQLRQLTRADGPWAWSVVGDNLAVFGKPLHALANLCLGERGWPWWIALRSAAGLALALYPHAGLAVCLWVTTLGVALRFGGSFNGGSDFMTLVLLTALSVGLVEAPGAITARGALWYIGLHTVHSYTLAGWAKVREPSWRSGQALPVFLREAIYPPSPGVLRWLQNASWMRAGSWAVIGFELAFPLALLDRHACAALIGCALSFHLANVFALGLNRFLWTWSACYPALWWCSIQSPFGVTLG